MTFYTHDKNISVYFSTRFVFFTQHFVGTISCAVCTLQKNLSAISITNPSKTNFYRLQYHGTPEDTIGDDIKGMSSETRCAR